MEYYSVVICDEEYLSQEDYKGNGIRLDDITFLELNDLIKIATRNDKKLIIVESYTIKEK